MIHKFLFDTPLTCKVRMRKNLIFCSQNFRNNGEVKCGNKMALQQQQNKKILQKCHKNQQSIQAISMAPASFALCQLACYISISIFKSHLYPNPKLYIGVRISVANQKFCFWDDTIVEQFFQQPFCFNSELLRNVSGDIKYAILGPYFDNNRRSMLLYFTSKK